MSGEEEEEVEEVFPTRKADRRWKCLAFSLASFSPSFQVKDLFTLNSIIYLLFILKFTFKKKVLLNERTKR